MHTFFGKYYSKRPYWAVRTYFGKDYRNQPYVSNIPGKHEMKELPKTAILGTVHIFRKVQM